MKAKRKVLILVGVTVLGAAIAYVAFWNSRRTELVFDGRPLIGWLRDLDLSASPLERSNAIHAVQQIGTNAVPLLTAIVLSKTDPLKFELGTVITRHSPVQLDFAARWADAAYRQRLGVEGLRALGPAAVAAIPALSRQLTNEPYPGMAADGLAAIGKEGVPYLISALNCTNDQQRLTAIGAFQRLGPTAREALPHLKELYERYKSAGWNTGAITNAMYRIDAALAQTVLNSP